MDHAGIAYDNARLQRLGIPETILISEGTGKSATLSRDALIEELMPSLNKLFGLDSDAQKKSEHEN